MFVKVKKGDVRNTVLRLRRETEEFIDLIDQCIWIKEQDAQESRDKNRKKYNSLLKQIDILKDIKDKLKDLKNLTDRYKDTKVVYGGRLMNMNEFKIGDKVFWKVENEIYEGEILELLDLSQARKHGIGVLCAKVLAHDGNIYLVKQKFLQKKNKDEGILDVGDKVEITNGINKGLVGEIIEKIDNDNFYVKFDNGEVKEVNATIENLKSLKNIFNIEQNLIKANKTKKFNQILKYFSEELESQGIFGEENKQRALEMALNEILESFENLEEAKEYLDLMKENKNVYYTARGYVVDTDILEKAIEIKEKGLRQTNLKMKQIKEAGEEYTLKEMFDDGVWTWVRENDEIYEIKLLKPEFLAPVIRQFEKEFKTLYNPFLSPQEPGGLVFQKKAINPNIIKGGLIKEAKIYSFVAKLPVTILAYGMYNTIKVDRTGERDKILQEYLNNMKKYSFNPEIDSVKLLERDKRWLADNKVVDVYEIKGKVKAENEKEANLKVFYMIHDDNGDLEFAFNFPLEIKIEEINESISQKAFEDFEDLTDLEQRLYIEIEDLVNTYNKDPENVNLYNLLSNLEDKFSIPHEVIFNFWKENYEKKKLYIDDLFETFRPYLKEKEGFKINWIKSDKNKD